MPEEDEVLKLISMLIDIINLIMCFEFKSENLNLLACLIRDFLYLCSKFSGENGISMSIKFHHLIHLPRQIQKFGPPRYFSTINFE